MASWLRDVRDLTLLYIAAGLSFAPWGVAYAFAVAWGWGSPVLALILLAGGALTALAVWNRLERVQKKSRQKVQSLAGAVAATSKIVSITVRGGSLTMSGTLTMRVIRAPRVLAPTVHAETLDLIGSAAARRSPVRDQVAVLILN